jgi:hypothetical protein
MQMNYSDHAWTLLVPMFRPEAKSGVGIASGEFGFPRSQPTEDESMDVGSVGSSYINFQTQALQRTPEAAEAKTAGPDNDGDSDDGGAKSVQAAPAPTLNLSGQKIGQVINVVA